MAKYIFDRYRGKIKMAEGIVVVAYTALEAAKKAAKLLRLREGDTHIRFLKKVIIF